MPRYLRYALWILVPATLVPLAIVAESRTRRSLEPRIHFFQGMDQQPKHKAQSPSTLFDDGRASRRPVAGTVARGHLRAEDHLYRAAVPGITVTDPATGKPTQKWYRDFPPQLEVREALVLRGRTGFDVFCAPCHGSAGLADGPVAKSFLGVLPLVGVARARSDGHIYTTIRYGRRRMPAYARIPTEDRWDIVNYVRYLDEKGGRP